jgi:uncharacterized membrane protein
MVSQSDRKTARLATTSLVLGILSFVSLISGVLMVAFAKSFGEPSKGIWGDGTAFSIGVGGLLVFFGGSIVGLVGCTTALITLRNKVNDNKSRRMASRGLVLGGVPVLIALSLFILAAVLSSRGPQRLPPTPPPPDSVK